MPEKISTHEAKTHLSRFLSRVEQGESFTIARGQHPVAVLAPLPEELDSPPRPKVGQILGDPEPVPDEALAPASDEELDEVWNLS